MVESRDGCFVNSCAVNSSVGVIPGDTSVTAVGLSIGVPAGALEGFGRSVFFGPVPIRAEVNVDSCEWLVTIAGNMSGSIITSSGSAVGILGGKSKLRVVFGVVVMIAKVCVPSFMVLPPVMC